MINEDWTRLERIFHEAIGLGAEEREPFLRQACSADPEQIPKIRSLIEAFEKDSDFLESAGFDAGLAVLGEQVPPATLAHTVIGQYEIGEKIGEGGMGEVYDAYDTKLNRRVALKFLANTFIDNNVGKRQLIREAQSAAMLDHTNICSIYDIEHIDGRDFIVMQFIGGMTLAEAIKTSQIDRALLPQIVKQIIAAASFAHSHGVIHRDLKPTNIMIEPDGKITVLDFGLAKTVKSVPGKDEHSVASQNGLIIGTVSYMSPEQLRGERLDYQSDIFSIGVTLYELISGKNPFTRGCQVDTIAAVLGEEPPRLTGVDPRISTDMSEMVAKCLEKNKQKRFQSAAEILVSLENASDRRKRKSPIGRMQMAIVSAIFLLIVAAMVGFLFMRTQAGTSRSLAVLPIVNANENTAYLSDGLTESLTSGLAGIKQLKVTPSTIAAAYKARDLDPVTLGKELNVDFLMKTEIMDSAGALLLKATLLKTDTGAEIWKKEFSLDSTALINTLKTLPTLVAAELKVDANDGELEIIKKRQARFAAASDEQFRGRFYLNNRTKENIDKAIAAFTNATNIDPSYALAWAGLAEAYVSKSLPSYGSLTPREAKLKALDAANTALQLDADLCEAHTAMGLIQMRYDWDSAAAEKSFKRAIEINPDYAPAHYGYSYALVLLAKPDKALAEAQRARDLAPLARNFESNVARMYYFNREPLTAIPMLTKMLAEKPDENNVAYLLGLLYLEAGQYEDARVLYEKYYPTDKVYFAAQLGYAYGRLNRKTDAMRVMAELETRAKTETVPAQESAIIYLGLGDIDKAFELFDKSCNDRYPALPFILNEFFFDPYRTDRRYAELTACITPLS